MFARVLQLQHETVHCIVLISIRSIQLLLQAGTPERGGAGGIAPLCPLVRGAGGGGESALIDKNSNPKNMRYND